MARIEDINAKLDYLEITKALIKEAIESKGQEIEESDTFREFVDKISNIQILSDFNVISVDGVNPSNNVGDTITFDVISQHNYKIGDYVPILFSKTKNGGKNSGTQYIYQNGIGIVTDIEEVSSATTRIYLRIVYKFSNNFPEFVNATDRNGIKFANSATDGEQIWYSYTFSNLDVQAQDVLYDKKFQSSAGIESGSMPNNEQLNYTPTSSAQTIPEGYTSGGTISAMDITTTGDYTRCLNLTKSILGIE